MIMKKEMHNCHITPFLRSTSSAARMPDSQLEQGGVCVKVR
jgi:hypothetical protein